MCPDVHLSTNQSPDVRPHPHGHAPVVKQLVKQAHSPARALDLSAPEGVAWLNNTAALWPTSLASNHPLWGSGTAPTVGEVRSLDLETYADGRPSVLRETTIYRSHSQFECER